MFPTQSLFSGYSPRPLNDVAVPPFPALEADEEDESRADTREFDFELPVDQWRAIPPGPSPEDAPVRFVDGTIVSRVTGSITVGGRRRPLIAATIAAACLEIEGRALKRTAWKTDKVLCVNSNGIEPSALLQANASLEPLGARLLDSEAEEPGDFDTMRRSTRSIAMLAMEEAERDVMLEGVTRPTLVDGLLERRLQAQRHDVPVVGLVKRQIATYLPWELQELAYSLEPGERTPAFILRTVQHVDIVNCYLRLSAEAGASPTYGLVRMTVPLQYVQRTYGPGFPSYLSGLAGHLYRLRHRDLAYDRAGISIEPIVRVEDHLHALRPNLDTLIHKLHGLLRQQEVAVGRR
jgi:hypothetical protein